MQGNKETSITFRTTEDLKKRLEKLAASENRSLSNYLQNLIEKCIKNKK